ncbi:hypothetical protein BpHYR1_016274 [Brachionus plicatilis]|uniref:Uncharacterized protein n=1 Tax=Brachionus plicatilis TaxID=10195 RepID=A0A3M7RK68_BRAPC|nr:hypothetical protein BpHYR1_016274 [Brachionus plicatilis]
MFPSPVSKPNIKSSPIPSNKPLNELNVFWKFNKIKNNIINKIHFATEIYLKGSPTSKENTCLFKNILS